ncbi:hypothetical protein L1987_03805 [Smallanthus sonchifolius]|uniref:Uncharacterized protein n=1 Tax=Smallanthus sonchifolius TaxID=185202 RepID=A0ACB9KBP2_9ASTR|nr:hypothetical protein L1987_03805 [Smallanthus sonchifolius]
MLVLDVDMHEMYQLSLICQLSYHDSDLLHHPIFYSSVTSLDQADTIQSLSSPFDSEQSTKIFHISLLNKTSL